MANRERQPAEVAFLAAFDGPAVEAGRMNAKHLAPSLFATASLVEASATALFGVPESITVQVKADFRRGSFQYELVAVAAVVGQQLLQNLSISDLDTLLRYLGFKSGESNNLFALLRRIGSRRVEAVTPQPDGKVAVTITGDNATVIVGRDVAGLLSNPAVREAIPDVVSPLSKPGIDTYRVGPARNPDLVLTKDDLPALQASADIRAELTDDTATTALELHAPNFVEGNKWRVAQGGEAFWVSVVDRDFLASIERGERSFRKGDYLIVQLRTKAFATPGGLQVDRDVVRVIEHRQRARQLPLL